MPKLQVQKLQVLMRRRPKKREVYVNKSLLGKVNQDKEPHPRLD